MSGKKILLVEGFSISMEFTTSLLEKASYTVLQAENAEQGIALAKAEKPALILMDLRLQGMDGLTATKLLKQDSATKDIPIIALTADHINEEEALKAGCVDCISKPYDCRVLLGVVVRFISCNHINSDFQYRRMVDEFLSDCTSILQRKFTSHPLSLKPLESSKF